MSHNTNEFSKELFYKNLWKNDTPIIDKEWGVEHKWEILGILYQDLQKCIHEYALDRIADKTMLVILKFILENYPVVGNLDLSSRYNIEREEKEMNDFNIMVHFFKLEKYIVSGMYDSKCGLFTCELNPDYKEEYFAFECNYIMRHVMDWTLSTYGTNYDDEIEGYDGRRLLDNYHQEEKNYWYPDFNFQAA